MFEFVVSYVLVVFLGFLLLFRIVFMILFLSLSEKIRLVSRVLMFG